MLTKSVFFYNFSMMLLSFMLAASQGMVYLWNYPNDIDFKLGPHELFELNDPNSFDPELTLGLGGFFLIISIVFAVLIKEGNTPYKSDKNLIAFVYLLQAGLMAYVSYIPIGTSVLLLLTIIFGFVIKPKK